MAARTRRGTLRATHARAASVLVVAILIAAACQTVPYRNRSQMILLPESTELQMGLQSYQDVLNKSKMSSDTAATERLQRVGRRIAEASARTDYQWEFHLIEDKQVNAFLSARRQGRRLHGDPARHAGRGRTRRGGRSRGRARHRPARRGARESGPARAERAHGDAGGAQPQRSRHGAGRHLAAGRGRHGRGSCRGAARKNPKPIISD